MKNRHIYIVCMFLCLFGIINAQDVTYQTLSTTHPSTQQMAPDTIPVIQIKEVDLSAISDLRSQFEKQNKTYASPQRPSQALQRFLDKDKLEMSEEAKRLAHATMDSTLLFAPNITYKDTVIASPFLMPLVFKGMQLPENIRFYTPYSFQEKDDLSIPFAVAEIYPEFKRKKEFTDKVFQYIERNRPDLFKYTEKDLPQDKFQPAPIQKDIKEIYENSPIPVQTNVEINDIQAPPRFLERLYWKSAFESAIQFSQNYVSPNWHKGGTSNLNLYTRNYMRYDYKKDKTQLTNEVELKISAYTAPKDTLRNYKMGDDLLRIHSNFGYQAFNKWYYTLDGEIKTQLFNNYKENNRIKLSALLAPVTATFGIGMKYELKKKYKNKHKNLAFSLNMAPFSYTYMYSRIKDQKTMDLGRHGFEKDPETGIFKNSLSQFGSNVRADLTINFNRNVSWTSRLSYKTSYERVECEFENTLTMAINRFFSTRIYAHLRYDDGIAKTKDFDNYFQLNELLSFGFNYKW
ncbi:DUF3078 domain-containing protein [Parabacteroides sp. 52]|nr:hypothetical protein [Parabacteroides sp. PM5-20]NDV54672.1 DUF3078 domain-containing protein [Parabacteroides sp. 52]